MRPSTDIHTPDSHAQPTTATTQPRVERSFDAAETARAARAAQRTYGAAPGSARTGVLARLATLLAERQPAILAANRRDLDEAAASGLDAPLVRRLGLTPAKLATLIEGVRQLAESDDPVGRPIARTELDDGLVLEKVRSPLGVLLILFESRPDAVVQIGSLALRAGCAVILKGGSGATWSNRALVGCLRDALRAEGQDPDVVIGVEGRSAVRALLDRDDEIDLVIPRGSGALVRSIQGSTRIPVLGHAEGVCHLYVDTAADVATARRLAIDGKCDYPAACNATETLLVHRAFLPFLSDVTDALREAGVHLLGDAEVRAVVPSADAATADDWRREYGNLTLAIRTVDGLDQAIDHIHRFGSAHTDAIVTENAAVAESFLRRVDSASVFWNASTRFADGYRYGLGAEVGIATGRLHARGPVGVEGLSTTRWLLRGRGQVASDYGPDGRPFSHRALAL